MTGVVATPPAVTPRHARGRVRPTGTPADRFRPDIQALRALAVTLVVVYHLWPTRLTGGYVGVDVFFVISGYLITSHMWREAVETGGIRLGRFWARRARRLLPSALTVLLFTAVASIWLLPAATVGSSLKEILASVFYGENWFLAASSVDYQAAESAASPVRHYWSLSVEEQFYVMLPLLLVGAIWFARRARLPHRRVVMGVIVSAALASFGYGLWLTAVSPAAYFSTFTRLWEFAFGAVVAIAVGRVSGRPWIAALGLVLIVGSAVAFDAATPFPGYHALVPVVGTALVLVGGSGTFVDRVGLWRPVAHVGRTSYAIYLWHWPLIVLAPALLGEEPGRLDKLAIAALTVVLATATTLLIEDPVRFSPRLLAGRSPRAVAAWSLAGMATVTLVVVAGMLAADARAEREREQADELAARLEACLGAGSLLPGTECPPPAGEPVFVPALADLEDDTGNRPECWSGLGDPGFHQCTVGSPGATGERFLVLGDSHSNALLAAYDSLGRTTDWTFDLAGHAGCYPTTRTLHGPGSARDACDAWRAAALEAIEGAHDYDAIIVTRRRLEEPDPERRERDVEALVEAWNLAPEGVPVLVLPDNPRMDRDFVACLESEGPRRAHVCGAPVADALPPDLLWDAADQARDARVVDLTRAYCADGQCSPVIGSVIVYRPDGHHVSATYAATVAPFLEQGIEAALAGRGAPAPTSP